MYGGFAGFGNKGITFNANNIANIHQLFPNRVIQGFILAGANIVAAYIGLYTAHIVLYYGKAGLTHVADAHDTAGQAYFLELLFGSFRIMGFDINGSVVY